MCDGDGNRVKGTVGGVTTTYIGNYFEWVSSTSDMKKYYYAGGTRVAMHTGSNNPLWLLGDHLGSTSKVANYDGLSVQSQQLYKPWGEKRYPTGAPTLPTTFRYTGQRSETGLGPSGGEGLMFYSARWYDPAVGRFVQPDTIIPGGVQGLDRYAYTANNPVRYVDPSGHSYCDSPNADPEECGGVTEEEYQIYLQDHPLPQGMELPPELPERIADCALMDAFVYLWNTPTGRAFAQLILDENVVLRWAESGQWSNTSDYNVTSKFANTATSLIEINSEYRDDPGFTYREVAAYAARDMAHEAVHVSMSGDENSQWQEYSAFRIESEVASELNSQGWGDIYDRYQNSFDPNPRPNQEFIKGWMDHFGLNRIFGSYPYYPDWLTP
jgi:RHS repeat-associated protein